MNKNSRLNFLSKISFCVILLVLQACQKDITEKQEELQEIKSAQQSKPSQYETITYHGTQVKAKKVNGKYILGGDMVVVPDDPKATSAKGFTQNRNLLWPSNVIPYVITDKNYKRNQILTAIKQINTRTNIQLVPRRDEKAYIKFIANPHSGSYADLGYLKNTPSEIHLDLEYGWAENQNTILHELLHSIGLSHEHQRPDRDKYIKMHKKNYNLVKNRDKDLFYNLEKLPWFNSQTDKKRLDFNSIMIYGSLLYSANLGKNLLFMRKRKGGGKWTSHFRTKLSWGDVSFINKLYKKNYKPNRMPKWKKIAFSPIIKKRAWISYRFGFTWYQQKKKFKNKLIPYSKANNKVQSWEKFYIRPVNGKWNRFKIGVNNHYLRVKGNHLIAVKGLKNGTAFDWIPNTTAKNRFSIKVAGKNKYLQTDFSKYPLYELKIKYTKQLLEWEIFEYKVVK